MAKKPTNIQIVKATPTPEKSGPWMFLENLASDVALFYGGAFNSAANLALPYWLVKNVEHVKFLAAISSILLALKGVEAIYEPSQIAALPAILAVVLASFGIGWLIYVFVPAPVLPDGDDQSGQRNQRNIACTFLLICLLSIILHEILLEAGISNFFDPSDPPFGIAPIENPILRTAMYYASSAIAAILGVLLIVVKQKIFDSKRAPEDWKLAGNWKAIGPLAVAYLIPVSFFVYYLTV